MPKATPIEVRFWKYVDKDGPIPPHIPNIGKCWTWIGSKTRGDYGHIRMRNPRRLVRAHKVSYYLEYGYWSKMLVLHKCDNPSCVRPSHLFEGTSKDNTQDCIRKGRFIAKPLKGERAPAAKLKNRQVFEAIARHRGGEMIVSIAKDFGVTAGTISHIVNNRSWRSVTNAGE